jgi:pimeloyl-ACP methyl ester carboxylesterase
LHPKLSFRLNYFAARLDSFQVNAWDLIPVLLLLLVGVALGAGGAFFYLIRHWRRSHRIVLQPPACPGLGYVPGAVQPRPAVFHRPASWLAIRSRNLQAVQTALGLHNPKPCSWIEGVAREQKLFIAPPVNGWILIMGANLPEPADDVDVSFRFLLDLSRKLGHVQYFSANRVLGHHAWVRFEAGRVVRAYAWAGMTLWNQGIKSRAELELGLKCFHYFEFPERLAHCQTDVISSNTEKVPLLAARWSLDPAMIDERRFEHAHGIAGEPPQFY